MHYERAWEQQVVCWDQPTTQISSHQVGRCAAGSADNWSWWWWSRKYLPDCGVGHATRSWPKCHLLHHAPTGMEAQGTDSLLCTWRNWISSSSSRICSRVLTSFGLSFSAYRTRVTSQLKETRSVKSMAAHQETEAVATAHYTFQTHRALHHLFQRLGHFPELLRDERTSDWGGVVARGGRSWHLYTLKKYFLFWSFRVVSLFAFFFT